MDKFRQGLLGMMSDPLFQAGVGLLGRTDMPFGQALGGTMNDMAAQQMLQQRFKAQQQQEQQRRQAEAWYQQAGMGGVPADVRQQMLQRMFAKPDQTSLMQNLSAAGLQPGTPAYQAAMMNAINKPNSSVTMSPVVNVGGEKRETKYQEGLGGARVEQIKSGQQVGDAARRNAIRLNDLRTALSVSGSGLLPALQTFAAGFGIDIGENADAGVAAQAIISSLVPEQRAPGSGTMSDADLKLYRNSLPKLINVPGGNELILTTMEAINQYDIAVGDLADMAMNGDISYGEYRTKLRQIKNPIDEFTKKRDALLKGGSQPIRRKWGG